ncbi:uncharacterized protein [Haliotis asinina]|uniref:uncharacterized protein n=1 Tax=Haliotis asinina TaxID=109174 RepID=UPI00353190D3
MAAKSSSENVIMLSGPPCSGKSQYYHKMYKNQKDFCRVCPAELYKENPDFGLRDICLHICGLLKKGKRVVIDDVCDQHTTRNAYFTAIKKKFPACKMKVIQVRPKYGEFQCQWAAQFAVAASTPDTEEALDSKQAEIHKWFQSDPAVLDSQEFTDSLTVAKKSLPLTAVTNYKLEVPALFFQWEGLNTDNRNAQLTAQLCQGWATANRCGRVFIVCDGKNVSKGLINQQEENFSVRTFTKAVAKEVDIPVYVVQLTDLAQAGSFCVPQEPGILAYLQKRHCLHLHCRATQYIYASASHKAMAERAGVRHIKVSQVLHHPKLLVSAHSSLTPRIPELLQHMMVEAGDEEEQPAEIPLYRHLDNMEDGCIKMELPGGRREMLFAKNSQVVQNYQNDYLMSATRVGQVGSRIHNETWNRSAPSETPPSPTSVSDVPTLSSDSSTGSTAAPVRDLPVWMLGKSKKSPAPSLSKSDSASSTEGRSRFRKTVYVMTELELVEAARQVLKQGGREDLLEVLEKQAKEETGIDAGVPTSNKDQTHKSTVVPEGEFEDMLAVPTLSTDLASPRKRQMPAPEHSAGESTSLPSPAKRRTVSPGLGRRGHQESPELVGGSAENSGEEGTCGIQDDGNVEESHLRSRKHVRDVLSSIFD